MLLWLAASAPTLNWSVSHIDTWKIHIRAWDVKSSSATCDEQARILAQLRTGKSRLNDYLSGIGGVESDQCICGTGRETIRHFLFHCPKWTSHRQGIREKAADRWGDLSYFLGGRSHARNRDGSPLLDKEPWCQTSRLFEQPSDLHNLQNDLTYRRQAEIDALYLPTPPSTTPKIRDRSSTHYPMHMQT